MSKIKNFNKIMEVIHLLEKYNFHFDVTEEDTVKFLLEKYTDDNDNFSKINVIKSIFNSVHDKNQLPENTIKIGYFVQTIATKSKFIGIDFFYQEPFNNHLDDLLSLYQLKEKLQKENSSDKFDPLGFISRTTCNINFKKNIDIYISQVEYCNDIEKIEKMYANFESCKDFKEDFYLKKLINVIDKQYVKLKEIEINKVKENNLKDEEDFFNPLDNDFI